MPENPDKSAELRGRALQNKARNCRTGHCKTRRGIAGPARRKQKHPENGKTVSRVPTGGTVPP